jgi:hypothetical protein
LPPPTTIAEVLARMREIEASGRKNDGVVCFARLYLSVTEAVAEKRGDFADPQFLERLDVEFANLFFAALDAPKPPHAWAPLLSSRARKGIAPLQFALAGMNAHINADLPVALVATWQAAGVEPSDGSPEHADYQLVNSLLARVEAQVKASYLTGFVAVLDRILHRLDRIDDVVAMWDISRAREAAWTNAEVLWSLREEAGLRGQFLQTLDRMVGLASRGLLCPAETRLRKLARKLF